MLFFKIGIKHHAGNYRPISLLSLFDKMFEKILCRRLTSFLEKCNVIYNYQFGFRKLHSTTLSLMKLTDYIKRSLDERKYVLSVLIDPTKAFDTMNHEILLNKLEYYGIRGHANDFFKSYLSNRRQYTVVNGIKSKLKCVPCGVPQGSVLGPLFFLLYINDIYRAVGENGIRLFADNTSLSVCSPDLDELKRNAKIAFEKLYSWCTCNKLTINNDKTHFILFNMKNKPVPRNFSDLHTDVMKTDRVEATKYLGVILDEKLTLQEQISSVCSSLL